MGFNKIPNFIINNSSFTKELLIKLAYFDSDKELPSNDLYKGLSKQDLYEKCIQSINSDEIDLAWAIINFLSSCINE